MKVGLPFLSKMAYKRLRVGPWGGASPYKLPPPPNSHPPLPLPGATMSVPLAHRFPALLRLALNYTDHQSYFNAFLIQLKRSVHLKIYKTDTGISPLTIKGIIHLKLRLVLYTSGFCLKFYF